MHLALTGCMSQTWFLLNEGDRYVPDFWTPMFWIEVKGFMTDCAADKMARFKRDYPAVQLLLLDVNVYSTLARDYRSRIQYWEK